MDIIDSMCSLKIRKDNIFVRSLGLRHLRPSPVVVHCRKLGGGGQGPHSGPKGSALTALRRFRHKYRREGRMDSAGNKPHREWVDNAVKSHPLPQKSWAIAGLNDPRIGKRLREILATS
jgi:hypothetical protein